MSNMQTVSCVDSLDYNDLFYFLVNNLFLNLLINFKAGISSGYVMKPCLDPFDPECPKTAPNYKTKKVIIPVVLKKPVKHVY